MRDTAEPPVPHAHYNAREARGLDVNIKDAKILVGTPNYTNTYPAEVYSSHMECQRQWTKMGLDYQFLVVGRNFVHFARTKICQAAVQGGWTHILWLDDDAVIDPDILPKMLEHDKDVVIAPYPMRRSPFEVGVLLATEYECSHPDHESVYTMASLPELEANPPRCPVCDELLTRNFHNHKSYRNLQIEDLDCGLQPVDGGGTHCMLIKAETLTRKPEKVSDPLPKKLTSLLDRLSAEDREVLDHNVGNLPDVHLSFKDEDDMEKHYFTMPKSGTEDMLWCYRARYKGIEVHVDTDLFADHVGFAPVITRKFREMMEDTGGPAMEKADRHGVAVMDVEKGRDHTRMVKSRDVSMI